MSDAESFAAISEQVRAMAADVVEIKQQVATLTSSLERLARMEERQLNYSSAMGRLFETQKEHDNRIKTMEMQEPIAKLVHKWVILGVLGVVGMFGMNLVTTVMSKDKPIQIIIDKDDDVKARRQQQ